MATLSWTASTKGADDFELGIPRNTPLVYHCTAPADGKAAGLVFLIPDFNDDVDGEEFVRLREHLAQTYGLLAVSVEYHCYRSRLKDGAQLLLSNEEFAALSKICMSHGVALLDRQALIPALKQLPKPYEFEFRVIPANGEYQNFGVMQAMDHLLVLHHLMQSQDCDFEVANVLLMGAGHGGYLAHMIAKFAPNAIRAVFDADSKTSLPTSYLFGEEAGNGAPYYYHLGNIRIFPVIDTRWQPDLNSMAAYNAARAEIRDTALASHIGSMSHAVTRALQERCHYRILISTGCDAVIATEKGRQTQLLEMAGFNVVLRDVFVPESKILVKGGGVQELIEMFSLCYSTLPPLTDAPIGQQSSVSYLCGDLLYCYDSDEFGYQANTILIQKNIRVVRYY